MAEEYIILRKNHEYKIQVKRYKKGKAYIEWLKVKDEQLQFLLKRLNTDFIYKARIKNNILLSIEYQEFSDLLLKLLNGGN